MCTSKHATRGVSQSETCLKAGHSLAAVACSNPAQRPALPEEEAAADVVEEGLVR